MEREEYGMTDKIALTLDESNNFCTFAKTTQLKILTKSKDFWHDQECVPLALNVENTNELRIKIRDAITKISPCHILLSVSISGIPYYIFDKMGFSIFEANNATNELLDEILEEIDNNNNKKTAANTSPSSEPIKITEGCYHLDYLQLEQKNPLLTTKKVLLPFLQNTPFLVLTMLCSHFPPWLKNSGFTKKLDISTEQKKEGLLLTIQKKTCEEN